MTAKLITIGLFVFVAAPSWASPASQALDAVEAAIEEARDEGGRCQRAVAGALEDVADDLHDAKRAKTSTRKLRRALEKVADTAEDDCPRGVTRALSKAIAALSDDERDDEDEGDRGDRGKRGKKKAAACWNDEDPGCGATRGGNAPMSRAAFESLMTAVRGAKPHVFPMQDVVRSMMGNQYITSMQLAILVEEFKPHIFPMQDVVKACAPHLVDPQNGGVVSAKFQPHVFPMQDVARVISAQSGD